MVKKTVNQDDPTVYHLFYADEIGSAGADLTFFEYPGAPTGRQATGWCTSSLPGRLGGVTRLLAARVGGERRVDGGRASFDDPEGIALELLVVDDQRGAADGDHPEIPAEVALRGLRRRARVRGAAGAQRRLLGRPRLRAEAGVRAATDAAASTPTTRHRASAASARRARCTTSRGPRRSRSTRRGATSVDRGRRHSRRR